MRKSDQLQIRVTAGQKRRIEEQARCAGKSVSGYVLDAVLGTRGREFQDLARALSDARPDDETFALAAIHDLLAEVGSTEFEDALPRPVVPLPVRRANLLAAMVEYAARRRGVAPPAWTAEIKPLDRPLFATEVERLRPYLLVCSPVEFRRRNIFVDASIGERV